MSKFDFNNPMKRPAPIIAAMGQAADDRAFGDALAASQDSPAEPALIAGMTPEQLDTAVREAALVLPGKQAVREIAQRLAEELDEHLDTALREALDVAPGDNLVEVVQAHVFEVVPDGAFSPDGEFLPPEARGGTYVLDGKPLLWAGPVELTRTDEGEAVQVRGSRRITRYKAAADSIRPSAEVGGA